METQVKITGVINTVSMKKDRKGNPMAFFTLEDSESEVEVVVFSKVYESCSSYLKERELVFVEGRVDATADNPKILANKIFLFSEVEEKNNSFHIKINQENWEKSKLEKLKNILQEKKGKNSVYLHFQGNNGENAVIKSKIFQVDFSEEVIIQIEKVIGKGMCWIGK